MDQGQPPITLALQRWQQLVEMRREFGVEAPLDMCAKQRGQHEPRDDQGYPDPCNTVTESASPDEPN